MRQHTCPRREEHRMRISGKATSISLVLPQAFNLK
jgi:hypothetical protein